MTAHVALRTQMLPRSQYSLECLLPIPHRLAIHPYNDMADNRRSDPFVGKGKVNVGRIAAVEFEDGPHRGTHLLALHVSGITGHTQSAKSHEGRDHCVISAGATRFLVVRHEPTLVLSGKFPSCCHFGTVDFQRLKLIDSFFSPRSLPALILTS